MNDMAGRMEAFQPESTSSKAQQSLSEIEAFMCFDEVLAGLNKEYLDAKQLEVEKDKEKQLDKYIYWSQTVQKIREMNTPPRIFEWAILLSVFKITPFDQFKDFHSYVPKTA